MREHYPTFRSPELSSLVEQLKDFEGKIDEEQKNLDSLRTNRDSTDEELMNRTYEWLVHYELKIELDGGHESWRNSFDVVGWKSFHGEYVETEEGARQQLLDAKREVASLLNQKVKVRTSPRMDPREGTVTDYNISWAQINRGRFKGPDERNIVFEEKRPDHQPSYDGWE